MPGIGRKGYLEKRLVCGCVDAADNEAACVHREGLRRADFRTDQISRVRCTQLCRGDRCFPIVAGGHLNLRNAQNGCLWQLIVIAEEYIQEGTVAVLPVDAGVVGILLRLMQGIEAGAGGSQRI